MSITLNHHAAALRDVVASLSTGLEGAIAAAATDTLTDAKEVGLGEPHHVFAPLVSAPQRQSDKLDLPPFLACYSTRVLSLTQPSAR